MEYILSIGINDYRNRSGGTNKVILAHQALFRNNKYGYIYICPVKEKNPKLWEVIINNRFSCVRNMDHLINFLYNLQLKGNNINEIHIHHLMTAPLDAIDKLLSYVAGDIKYYIHDYYSICPSIKLMKNDMEFCGSEMMTKIKCRDCKYYQHGMEKNKQLRKLFMKYERRITFIAPSDVAKQLWLKAYRQYSDRTIVIWHQKLQGTYTGNRELIENQIKVGYLGETSYPKGWATWNKIVKMMPKKNYQFFYFGKSKLRTKEICKIFVDFRKDLDAMLDALREKQIDCVLLWSLCEETYSYTYYESLASNIFVITNKQSGNIARQIEIRKNGIVLHDEKELIELFQDFNLLKRYVNDYKQSKYLGPEKLIENPEILDYINANIDKSVSKIDKSIITLKERMISAYYKFLQGIYYMKKVLS